MCYLNPEGTKRRGVACVKKFYVRAASGMKRMAIVTAQPTDGEPREDGSAALAVEDFPFTA